MLQSAVNSCALFAATLSGQQLTASEQAEYRKNIEPSLVMVMQGGVARAPAVLIDSRGLFLCHRDAASLGPMFGKLSNGQVIQLSFVSKDDITQLALLRSEGWTPIGRTPVTVVRPNSFVLQNAKRSAVRLIAALPNGPIRIDLVDTSKVGVLSESKRAMTLSELRFENPQSMIGGGLVFTTEGQLTGVLGAALEPMTESVSQTGSGAGGGGASGRGGIAEMNSKVTFMTPKIMGPADLTVAYSISPDIVERVVQGFLSPSHRVEHPALGIMCRKDLEAGGAFVQQVAKGSTAEAGGLRVGDVIIEMNGEKILDQSDYARQILKQTIGSTVMLKIRRGQEAKTLQIVVGK